MNVYELFAALSLNTQDYEAKLEQAEGKGSSTSGSLTSKFVSMGKKVGVALAGVATAAASSISAMTVASVKSYAQYEQLVGGVQKLYGAAGMSLEEYAKSVGQSTSQASAKYNDLIKAQDLVMKNAQKAFSTAGMSANEYMETATQFSASLVNALGGDTVKAATYTDTAMRAISDNVNTFGSNMEDVSNAFKGFSKQNYTMLDNLKLGYGGTKEEMQRLIDDANAYGKANGEAANLSINSFADIITAIQQIQEKQQIAGTTSNEAATTIEGSFNALKSAWDNLVTGFADPDQDIGQLIQNIFDTGGDFAKNLIPRVQNAMTGMATAIETALPVALEKIPEGLEQIIPNLADTTMSLLETLGTTIADNADNVMTAGMNIVQELINGIAESAPMLTEIWPVIYETLISGLNQLSTIGVELLSQIGNALPQGLPTLLAQVLPLIQSFTESLRANAGTLIQSGLVFIQNLVQGLMDSLPLLLEYVPTIIDNLANIINDNAPKVLLAGVNIIVTIGKGLIQAIPSLIANIPKILTAILDVFMAFNWIDLGASIVKALVNGIKSLATALPGALKDLAQKAITGFRGVNWASAGSNVLKFIVNGLKSVAASLPSALKTVGTKALSFFKAINWVDLGKNIITGIIKGIGGAASSLYNSLKNLAGNALNAAKKKLGIKSPSRVFRDEVGAMIPAGIAVGIEKNSDIPQNIIQKLSDGLISNADLSGFAGKSGGLMSRNSTFNITMTVNGSDDPEEWGTKFAKSLQRQERMGYA